MLKVKINVLVLGRTVWGYPLDLRLGLQSEGLRRRRGAAGIFPEGEWKGETARARVYLVNASFPLLAPLEAVEATCMAPRPA